MTIKHNSTTIETINTPVLDNYKDSAAYIWTAYDPADTDDFGMHPAYNLIYIIPDGVTDPDDIDWTNPDDIQPAGAYDPGTGRIC